MNPTSLTDYRYFHEQTFNFFPPPFETDIPEKVTKFFPEILREKRKMATVVVPQAIETQKKNRIQVSNTKKPLFFYVNLAKRYIQQHNEVELSALGMAITTVVTIAEILKNNGLATEKKVSTSTVGMKDENKGRLVQKAKIEIVLGKSEKFDSLMTTATVAPEPVADDDKENDK